MIEALSLGLCIAIALAGFLLYPRDPRPLARDDLMRYRRLSDEARRVETHPFE